MTPSSKYKKIDKEIIAYLEFHGESKTRTIIEHMRDEFDEFARSTLWSHLVKLQQEGKINQRITVDGQGLAYWSLNEEKKP